MGGAGGTMGGGGTAPGAGVSICPSRDASEEARWITPTTTSRIGHVFSNETLPPRTSCSRNNNPTVITSAGPVNPRIAQLWQLHRTVELTPLLLSASSRHAIPQHQKADPDQQHRPENPPQVKLLEKTEIVQQNQPANAD